MMRRDLVRYVSFAYGFTWLAVSPLVAAHLGMVGPVPEALHALGAFGPLLAALVVAQPVERRHLLRSTFRRKPSRFWLLVAVGSPLLLLILAIVGLWIVNPDALALDGLARSTTSRAWWINVAIGSVLYGVGEEPGWRGFALPRLQQKLPAWSATLMLSVFWALWHAPFFFYRFALDGVGTVIGFLFSMVAGAFWLTFLYNSSGGSIMSVALWHTVWNVVNFVAAAVSMPLVAVMNGLMTVLGFGVLFSGPQRLSVATRPVQRS